LEWHLAAIYTKPVPPKPRTKVATAQRRGSTRQPQYAFGFLDETGTLGSPRDPIFAVGLMRTRDPYELQRPMQRIRDK
jgi:hypothetical protein